MSYVSNFLKIYGSKMDILRLLRDIKQHLEFDDVFDFNFIVPMPPHQPDVSKPNAFWRGDITEDTYRIYGDNNERSWAIENWGSVRGTNGGRIGEIWGDGLASNVNIEFLTPYDSVEFIIEKMSIKYPTLKIEYEFSLAFGSGANLTYQAGEMYEPYYYGDIWDIEDVEEE